MSEELGNATAISVEPVLDFWQAKVRWGRGRQAYTVQCPCATREVAEAWVNVVKKWPAEVAFERFGPEKERAQ